MMPTKFSFIEEFIAIKSDCIFCNSKLEPIFTNFCGTSSPAIPILKISLKDSYYSFNFRYNSYSANIDTKVIINTRDNTIKFSAHPSEHSNIIDALESLSPHVELQCCNKKCKMNYYLCTSILRISGNSYIRPFRLEYECFNLLKFWIKNDFASLLTDIYIKNSNYSHKPIQVPLIHFDSLEPDKLKNRILTLVNFS